MEGVSCIHNPDIGMFSLDLLDQGGDTGVSQFIAILNGPGMQVIGVYQ
jgi:hypothetical protein